MKTINMIKNYSPLFLIQKISSQQESDCLVAPNNITIKFLKIQTPEKFAVITFV